ncbi:alanine racemase, partial [Staphylococcus epidermidis]
MSEKFYRATYLNVNLDAILANYQNFNQLHANKTVISVIKANGYGLGSVKIAQHLMRHGATFFAVATLDEAIELRMHGVDAKLLVLGVVPTEDIEKAIQHR